MPDLHWPDVAMRGPHSDRLSDIEATLSELLNATADDDELDDGHWYSAEQWQR